MTKVELEKPQDFLIYSQAYSLDPGRNSKPSTFTPFSANLLLLLAFLFLFLMSPFSFAYDFTLSEILHGPKWLNFTVMEPGRQYSTKGRNVSYYQQLKWGLGKKEKNMDTTCLNNIKSF